MGGLGGDPDGEWGAEDNLPFLLANPMDRSIKFYDFDFVLILIHFLEMITSVLCCSLNTY